MKVKGTILELEVELLEELLVSGLIVQDEVTADGLSALTLGERICDDKRSVRMKRI